MPCTTHESETALFARSTRVLQTDATEVGARGSRPLQSTLLNGSGRIETGGGWPRQGNPVRDGRGRRKSTDHAEPFRSRIDTKLNTEGFTDAFTHLDHRPVGHDWLVWRQTLWPGQAPRPESRLELLQRGRGPVALWRQLRLSLWFASGHAHDQRHAAGLSDLTGQDGPSDPVRPPGSASPGGWRSDAEPVVRSLADRPADRRDWRPPLSQDSRPAPAGLIALN